MFYVLTDGQGSVVSFPYTLTDLRRDNPDTSFPKIINAELAASYNCFPVSPTPRPEIANPYEYDFTPTAVYSNDSWVEQWTTTPATPEEIQRRTLSQSNLIRAQRDELLENSDWTQLPDTPVDPAAWTTYRQDLRNVPQQAGFPWDVTWPTPPST